MQKFEFSNIFFEPLKKTAINKVWYLNDFSDTSLKLISGIRCQWYAWGCMILDFSNEWHANISKHTVANEMSILVKGSTNTIQIRAIQILCFIF